VKLLPVINIKGFKFTNSITSVAQLRTGIFSGKITLILSRKFNPYLEQSLLTAAPTRRGTEDRDNGQDHLLVTGPGGSDLKPVTMTVNSEINPTSLNFEFIRSIPVERHIVPRQITVQKFSED
jgi:hypothetical protein